MTTIHHEPKASRHNVLAPTPLTAVTVNVTGGNQVLASATGDYEVDTVHGVIHANVFPPAAVSNGGPDTQHTYVLRGTAPGGNPVGLVGLAYIGRTSAGTYKFAYNMSRLQADPTAHAEEVATSTPITRLRIAQQRPSKFVATAPSGTYLHARGFASQVVARDAVAEPGQHLVVGKLYAIAANGMPSTQNLQLTDIIPELPTGTLAIFVEVMADANAGEPSEP